MVFILDNCDDHLEYNFEQFKAVLSKILNETLYIIFIITCRKKVSLDLCESVLELRPLSLADACKTLQFFVKDKSVLPRQQEESLQLVELMDRQPKNVWTIAQNLNNGESIQQIIGRLQSFVHVEENNPDVTEELQFTIRYVASPSPLTAIYLGS